MILDLFVNASVPADPVGEVGGVETFAGEPFREWSLELVLSDLTSQIGLSETLTEMGKLSVSE